MDKSPEQEPRSVGTHNGPFHADEVTACALLNVFDKVDLDRIYRTRDPNVLARCTYVCDVGGEYDPSRLLFDHHQSSYTGDLSSAGMILLHLKEIGEINQDTYRLLNGALVRGVDAHDNGKELAPPGVCTFSHVISNFSPINRESTEEEYNAAFQEAVRFTVGHLRRALARQEYIASCRAMVSKAMARHKNCLIFEDNIPWIESFFDLDGERHPATFVVMPSGDHWKLRGIPPSYSEKMKVRIPLPEEWAGLLEGELRDKTGIEGAIFCHKGRFISVWKTREDALKALDLVMAQRSGSEAKR